MTRLAVARPPARGVRWIADRHAAAGVGARHRPVALLPDVGQLMSEPAAPGAVRGEGTAAEDHLVAHGVGPGGDGDCQLAALASVWIRTSEKSAPSWLSMSARTLGFSGCPPPLPTTSRTGDLCPGTLPPSPRATLTGTCEGRRGSMRAAGDALARGLLAGIRDGAKPAAVGPCDTVGAEGDIAGAEAAAGSGASRDTRTLLLQATPVTTPPDCSLARLPSLVGPCHRSVTATGQRLRADRRAEVDGPHRTGGRCILLSAQCDQTLLNLADNGDSPAPALIRLPHS